MTNAKGEERTAALRKRGANNLKRRMTEISERGEWDGHARSCVGSYSGWLKWCDAHGLIRTYVEPTVRLLGGHSC